MPQIVNVKGYGPVTFPDGMSQEDMAAAIMRNKDQFVTGAAPAAAPPAGPPTEVRTDSFAADGRPNPPMYLATGAGMTPSAAPRGAPITAGVQGAGRGMADIAGMPFDLSNAAANIGLSGLDWASRKLGGPEVPFRFANVSDAIANKASSVAEAAGVPVLDPETMSLPERTAYNINRFGTQTALTAPMMAGAAMPRATAFRQAETLRQGGMPALAAAVGESRTGDAFLRPYMGADVGRTLAGDAAAGVGAGVATTAVDEIPGLKDSALAKAVAPIVGGSTGVLASKIAEGAARGGARLAGRPFGTHLDPSIRDPETGAAVRAAASDRAAGYVQRYGALPSEESVVRLTTNRDELAPYLSTPPSALQMTEDPGLAILDRQLGMKAGGNELLRLQKFNSAVRDTVDRTVPENASLADLQRAAQAEADARIGAADRTAATAENRVNRVADIRGEQGQSLAVYRGNKVPASQELHQSLVEGSYLPERAYKNEMFNAIDPERSVMVDTRPLADAAQRVRESLNVVGPQRQDLPGEFVTAFEQLFPQGAEAAVQAPAQDIARLRMPLSTAIERARQAGNFTLADNLAALRRAIPDALQGVPGAAEAGQTYGAFRDVFRPNRTDEMARLTREIDRGGNPPPSQTAGRFLQPGRPEKSGALGRWMGATDDPASQQAVQSYLLADLAESNAIDRNGAIRADVVARWRDRHAANIDLVPGLRDEVDGLIAQAQKGERVAGTAAERLRAAQTGQKRTQAEIDKGALGLVLSADPDKAVKAVMDNTNRSGRLLGELIDLTANDSQARNGLKAAVHRYLVDKATTTATEKMLPGDRRGPVSPAKLANIMGEHETELAQIFTPEEMNGLRAGYKALQIANIERLRTGSGSDTTEKMKMFERLMNSPLGRGLDAAIRLHFGMLRGGGMLAVARRQAGGIPDTVADQAVRIVERAREDPEVLLTLLGRKLPVGSPAWNRKLGGLLGAAAGAREMNDNETQ